MSRTRRNVSHDQESWLYQDWVCIYESEPYLLHTICSDAYNSYPVWYTHRHLVLAPKTPTKKEVALCGADGKTWYTGRNKHWYNNNARRKIRAADRKLSRKIHNIEDYEDFDWHDDSSASYHKGLLWDIF